MDGLSTPLSTSSKGDNTEMTSSGIFISDDVLGLFNKAQYMVFMPILLPWALFAGCINIMTFTKMGIYEGINLNFLILSIADFLFAINQAVGYCIKFMMFMEYEPSYLYISFRDLNYYLSMLSNIPKTTAMIAYMVIAIARCLLVTFPLHAPCVVTTRRQFLVTMVLCGACMGFYIYIFFHYRFVTITDPFTNVTKLKVIDGPRHISNQLNNFMIASFFLFLAIILISLVILVKSLRSSSKFRDMMKSSVEDKNGNTDKRDVQVIKCVVYVALVYLICNSPYIFYNFLRYFLPGFSMFGEFKNEHSAVGIWMRIFAQLDIGCNFFGYYRFNSKFRSTANELICKCISSGDNKKSSKASKR